MVSSSPRVLEVFSSCFRQSNTGRSWNDALDGCERRELLDQVLEAVQFEPKPVPCSPVLFEAVGLGDVEQALANH